MILPESYIDAHNFMYRVWWQEPDGEIIRVKLPHYIPDDEVPAEIVLYKRERDFGGIAKLPFNADDSEQVIIDFVEWVRANPTCTMQMYNQYLNALEWYDATDIRTFVWRLAIGLAHHYGVILENYTELQVLTKVRNWLANANKSLVERVCFGRFNVLI